jgi:hypothetical protein
MRKETIEAAHLAPLLFRHAIPRTSSAELPGYYDNTKQLWVVETKGGIVAVVEAAATTIIQTNTSTRVHKEGDDKDCSNTVELATIAFAETTLTAVQMEVDDQDASTEFRSFEALLDTHTLTEVRQEGDDTDAQTEAADWDASTKLKCFNALLDTHTLTKVRQEADDSDITADETFVTRRHLGTLAELSTKTDVQQESDDQVNADEMLEFEAGKFNNNGVIDNPFPSILHELQNKAYGDVEGSGDSFSMIH